MLNAEEARKLQEEMSETSRQTLVNTHLHTIEDFIKTQCAEINKNNFIYYHFDKNDLVINDVVSKLTELGYTLEIIKQVPKDTIKYKISW